MNSNELIHRYFLGIATDDEVRELENRLGNDDKLKDAFLLHAELDAHLRQKAQSLSAEDVQPTQLPSIRNPWKWLSGISTLAATVLFALLLLNLATQKPAFAVPSLGDISLSMSWTDQNIWTAAGVGDLAAIGQSLQNNVHVDSPMKDGLAPLHLATLFDQKAAVELLLSKGANISLTDDEGNTALHMAAFLGHTDIVPDLLTAGSNPSQKNNRGFSAKDLVDFAWSSRLEEYYHRTEKTLNTTLNLKQIRAERPKISKLLYAADRTAIGSSPTISLWHAAMTGNTVAISQHIAIGTELDAREDVGGSTPLILAAIFGKSESAKALIGAGADLEVRNHSGGTALHLASFFCQPEVVELLLQAGADPNKTNNDGLTPLGIVTMEFNKELESGYRYVYRSLGLEVDVELIKKNRLRIAALLKEHSRINTEKTPNTNQGIDE